MSVEKQTVSTPFRKEIRRRVIRKDQREEYFSYNLRDMEGPVSQDSGKMIAA